MIRISKIADYAVLLVVHIAVDRTRGVHSARDLSRHTRVPLPTASKILKALGHAGLLTSSRGVGGGFRLARPAEEISVGAVITALEGPVALTECQSPEANTCGIERSCPVRAPWERVNRAIRETLEALTIADIVAGQIPAFASAAARAAARLGDAASGPPAGQPPRPVAGLAGAS